MQLKTHLLPRFLLRRTKTLIADQLPKKTDKVVFCPLTETQRLAYENLMECEDIELIKHRSEKCDCGSNLTRGACCHSVNAEGKRIDELIFPYLPMGVLRRYMMYVQKLSNHIAMMIPRNEDPPEKKAKDQQIIDVALPEQSTYLCKREPMLNYADAELCGKWKVLEKLLHHWHREESKVLIFSYSVRLLKMLDCLMLRKSYTYANLDGSMDLDQRTHPSIQH
jgi:SNF2 family DNA or RNA helicase